MLHAPNLIFPNITHRFFTREGGASAGVYASLNCGPGSGDAPEKVAANLRIAAQQLGGEIRLVSQIHSNQVVTQGRQALTTKPEADAQVTAIPGVALGILTADCAPVLFADSEAGVIGAAHAGWKGAFGGVLEATIAAMEKLGARRQHIAVAIGPCIAQRSYEVDGSFYQRFEDANVLYGTFFTQSDRPAYYRFDLPGFVRHRLLQCGLQNAHSLAMDTYSDETRFYSYRRMTHRGEADYGRQLSAIILTN